MEGPESSRWIEADTLERVQLEALECWRPVLDGELLPTDEIIPMVVIYTRKRCGRFKARAVALGNRQTQLMNSEIYSPTISHAGNRFLLAESAAKGHHVEQFDISNALIRANLNLEKDRVFVTLPKHWSSDSKGDKVRLLKSLYGLKIAPRRWFDCYRNYLESDGWKMAEREPGLFRKGELILCVYVDDSLIAGPNADEVREAQDRILERFTGKIIPAVMEGDVEVRDILGVAMHYCRARRTLKLSMEAAIAKLLEKFKMADCKPVATPSSHLPIHEGPDNETYPIRQLVGGLQYVASMSRPDIAQAVQRVAKQMHQCKDSTVLAAKRILRYLRGTETVGLKYSPAIERNFNKAYRDIAKAAGQSLPPTVAFSDSDFAGDCVSLYSTSGSILYHRGMPVIWSSKRQTVRAGSTCEAEYVALYDTIRLTQSQGYLDWFLGEDREFPLVFGDNESSLALSRSSIVTKRSKHIHLRYHTVRDFAKHLAYCPTDLNRADPLTKALPRDKYLGLFGDYGQKALFVAADFEFDDNSDKMYFVSASWW